MRVVAEAPPVLTGDHGSPQVYLVRPDGYVAQSASAADLAPIDRCLAEFLS